MKKIYQYGLSAALLFGGLSALAQNRPAGPSFPLGKTQALVQQLEAQVAKTSAHRTAPTVSLRVSARQTFTGKVNYRQDLTSTGEYVIGEIQGVPGSSFRLRIEGVKVDGNIILRNTKQAYQYSADAQGNARVQEVDINKVVCIDFNKPVGYQTPAPTKSKGIATANATAVVSLQSYPGARGCVMLDFDGQYVSGTPWNNGNPINAAPSGMTDAAIQEFWELVSEDYRPFSMNVTTDEAVFNSYPKTMRMRCIITPTNTAAPGAGGVAYVGSFNWNDDTPCWEFMTSAKAGGEAASHEIGHTLGLSHDGRNTNPREEYYDAQSTSGNWAPIMGAGYYKPVTHWSRGEYNLANNQEDDLAIMSGATYNVGYRNDDHSNGTAGATNLARNGTSLSGNGVIERTADQDFFTFTAGAGTVSLNVNTVSRHGDLDIVARLYNSGGGLIGTYDASGLNTALSVNVAAGTYYLSVDGIGFGNPATDEYSDYASLGTFTISGTAPLGTTPTAGVATMYKDCSYGGTAVGLDAGDYNLAALQARGILNDDISSLQVNTGYEVQLFADDNFTGASVIITASNTCLVGNNFNDIATSVKVRTSGVTNLSGIYTVQNRNSNLVMDVNGISTADGAKVMQGTANGGTNQQFRFTHLGGGVYQILAVHSGKALEIAGVSTADGAVAQQWTYVGGANQQFIAQSTGDGFFRLVAKHSSKVVEVADASTANGATVRQWPNNGSTCQQWKLTPVAGTAFTRQLEAEVANVNNGMTVEACAEGGQDMGYVDAADYLVWNGINFPTTGSYLIEYRVASGAAGGTISSDLNAGATQLGNTTIPGTGGWQTWTTVSKTVTITAGTYNFGIYAQTGGWNINWVRITKVGAGSVAQASGAAQRGAGLTLYPNPVTDRLTLNLPADFTGEQVRVLSVDGRVVWRGIYTGESVNVSALKPGLYTLVVLSKDQQKLVSRFSKQ